MAQSPAAAAVHVVEVNGDRLDAARVRAAVARELTVTAIALEGPRVTRPASYDGCASRSRPRTTGAQPSAPRFDARGRVGAACARARRERTPEARYNRALAEAPPGSYRPAEARSLLDALE